MAGKASTKKNEAPDETALNDKQELFCLEYIIDLNGTQAAIRAGYSEATARQLASKLLTKPNIRTRIKALMEARSESTLVDAGYVVESLLKVAAKCQQAVPVMEWDPEAKCMKPTGEFKFDSVGANRALELLGKHLAMFTDKKEVHSAPQELIIKGVKFATKA